MICVSLIWFLVKCNIVLKHNMKELLETIFSYYEVIEDIVNLYMLVQNDNVTLCYHLLQCRKKRLATYLYGSLKSSRPITILLISLVPAPISYSFASLRKRPVAYSFMYPFPPRHCIACNIKPNLLNITGKANRYSNCTVVSCSSEVCFCW